MARTSFRVAVWTALGVCVVALLATCGPSSEPFVPPLTDVWGVTASGMLVRFHLEDPQTILESVQLTGLAAGDSILAMSSRGDWILGRQSRLYTLDLRAGTLTEAPGMPFAPPLVGECFDMDSRLGGVPMVVMEGGRRQLPESGTVLADYVYAPGDPNAGQAPDLAGYVVNLSRLVDVANDVLARLRFDATVMDDALETIGPLGVDVDCRVGLASGSSYAPLQAQSSMAPDYVVVMVATAPGESTSRIYIVDQFTGAATLLGSIGWGEPIVDVTLGDFAL